MLATRLTTIFAAFALAVFFAGPVMLTATPSAAEQMSAEDKKERARARAKAAREKRAKAAKAKAAKSKAAKAKAAKEKKARMAKAKKGAASKQQAAKPETVEPEPAAPNGGQTQTAMSALGSTRLAKLARSIEEHMKAGGEDGSLTNDELARLASLKERVEIMYRMSRNDDQFSNWEERYLETANTILRDIVRRDRLNRAMSSEPRHVDMRIQRGLQDGTLTEREAENLREIQRRILVRRNEGSQGRDLSAKERQRYMLAQHRLSDLLNHTRRYGPIARTLGQNRFRESLARGVRNGSFSRREAQVLWRTHQRISGLRERAIADGKITPVELTVLNRQLQATRKLLGYGERKTYRRWMRTQGRRAGVRPRADDADGGGEAASAARRGAAAARAYGRSMGRGMRSLNRTLGGR